MQSIDVVLAMLLAVVASGYLVRMLPFSAPLPLVQIALGAVVAGVFGEGVRLDPEIFFLVFVPPLLVLDGWRIPKDDLRRDRAVVLEMALGLVVFTVVGAGFLVHWMIPSMPMAVAFALAAIVSPTDPVAVSSLAQRVPIPRRLMHILEGESLLNDASGLVCFRFAVAAAMTGAFSLAQASLTFLWVALAGLAVGAGFTIGVNRAQNWLSRRFGQESGTPILVSLLTPFGAYLIAEHLSASGILAAVAAGLAMSRVEMSGRALATTRVQRAAVWDTIQFALNGVMFVLLGEQLPAIWGAAIDWMRHEAHRSEWWLLVWALALSGGLVVLRFAWVWVTWALALRVPELRAQQFPYAAHGRPQWRLVAATSLAGVRGAITLAGVLSLPLALPGGGAFPARDLVIFLATSVILVSLLAASIGLPRVLHGLQLPVEAKDEREQRFALREAAEAAVTAIDRAAHAMARDAADADLYNRAAVRVVALYEPRRRETKEGGAEDAEALRRADAAERELRLVGLRAEREHVYALARAHRISDATARRLVRDIDLLEARQR